MKQAHFHHIHLNVTDKTATVEFYKKFFGAKSIKYRGRTDALFTERSFLLLDRVDQTAPSHLGSCIWHIGWAGVEGQAEFDWRHKEGINVHTPIEPLEDDHWMYFYGPDMEVIEVFTGNKNHTFEHIHLLASDIERTTDWFEKHLGIAPVFDQPEWKNKLHKWNYLLIDNINIFISGKPNPSRKWFPDEFKATKGTVIDHIGFSFENINEVYEQMQVDKADIIKGPSVDQNHGLRSFFVQGPDQLLIEIVEEKPIPEGIWS